MSTIQEDPATGESASGGLRVRVQRFGTFLSNMVMPNIGAFIAWGLITALFIETGWLTSLGIGESSGSWVAELGGWGDSQSGGLVGPMITYLLPLLIGYTGGRIVYDTRGGVVGAIATMGVIIGADVPMFLGAMIMGPFGGWSMKRIDAIWDGKIKPGFEMLVNNFAAGIWGGILTVLGFVVVGPFVSGFSRAAEVVVKFLVENNVLPLTSLLIEPAKVLFLNNAINHGVLTPLGTNQSVADGKSVLFLLEANPGPGLGLLLAFMVFGTGLARASAPGAAIIHFLGGIHEIYFPYVLMKPKLILAVIAGGMTGVFVNVIFDAGLRAPAAPGSIIAVLIQTANDSYIGVVLSVVLSATVSFLVAALLLKTERPTAEETGADGDLGAATARMESMKGKRSLAGTALAGEADGADGPVRSIVFACDAGMGSSAMGASVLRRKIGAAGIGDVTVRNAAIANLTDDVDLVISHADLTDRARRGAPSAVHVPVEDFMGSPRYDEIVAMLAEQRSDDAGQAPGAPPAAEPSGPEAPAGVIAEESIVLAGSAATREDAITEAGELLVAAGAAEGAYVDAMHEREGSVSTHMGNGLAIPHGTNEARSMVHRTALSFVRYPEPLDWGGKPVEFVVGIAGAGDDHLNVLSRLGRIFVDADQVERLRAASTPAEIRAVLDSVGETVG